MEQPLAAVLRRSSDAVVVIDLADGSILDANPAFLAATGHVRHELMARSSRDLLVEFGQAADRAAFELLRDAGSPADTPVGVWTRSGALQVGDLSALVLEVDGQFVALCMLRRLRDSTTAEQHSAARAELLAMVGFLGQRFHRILEAVAALERHPALRTEAEPLALLGDLMARLGELNRLLEDTAQPAADGPPSMEPASAIPTGLTLKAVSQRTGVPAATLRTWQHRYGFLRPRRAPSGHRLYGEEEIARIERVNFLVGQGVRIGAAMQAVIAEASDEPVDGEDRQLASQSSQEEEGKHADVYRLASRSPRRSRGG
jgi:PAS domain S-box-containing protein